MSQFSGAFTIEVQFDKFAEKIARRVAELLAEQTPHRANGTLVHPNGTSSPRDDALDAARAHGTGGHAEADPQSPGGTGCDDGTVPVESAAPTAAGGLDTAQDSAGLRPEPSDVSVAPDHPEPASFAPDESKLAAGGSRDSGAGPDSADSPGLAEAELTEPAEPAEPVRAGKRKLRKLVRT